MIEKHGTMDVPRVKYLWLRMANFVKIILVYLVTASTSLGVQETRHGGELLDTKILLSAVAKIQRLQNKLSIKVTGLASEAELCKVRNKLFRCNLQTISHSFETGIAKSNVSRLKSGLLLNLFEAQAMNTWSEPELETVSWARRGPDQTKSIFITTTNTRTSLSSSITNWKRGECSVLMSFLCSLPRYNDNEISDLTRQDPPKALIRFGLQRKRLYTPRTKASQYLSIEKS